MDSDQIRSLARMDMYQNLMLNTMYIIYIYTLLHMLVAVFLQFNNGYKLNRLKHFITKVLFFCQFLPLTEF